MSDEREISVEEVTGNTLDKLDTLEPTKENTVIIEKMAKAADVLLKNANETEKNEIAREQIESNERIEMARIEAEKVQREEENKLREKEIKASLVDSVLKSTVIGVVIGEVSYHVGMTVIGKFEESGTFRNLISKIWTGRLGKRK